jgi:hypothetical protein
MSDMHPFVFVVREKEIDLTFKGDQVLMTYAVQPDEPLDLPMAKRLLSYWLSSRAEKLSKEVNT